LALNLGLIALYLPLLIRLAVFLPLQLIADQDASYKSKRSADRGSCTRLGAGRTGGSAFSSSANGANAGAFFTRAEITGSTADH